MTLHLTDHLFFILFMLVFPVTEFFSLRKRARLIHQGRTELRMKLYRSIVWEEWAGTLAVVVVWFLLGRSASELGLIPRSGAAVWIGYTLAAAACGALFWQLRQVGASSEKRVELRKQVGWLSFLMPHTLSERRAFDLVSVTAGVCEELVYRGFLTAYLVGLLGVPFWAGAALGSIAFGLGHAYQGPGGMLRTGTAGALFALLYVLTGSLWAPIVTHTLMDFIAGRMFFTAVSDSEPANSSPELAA